MSALAIALREGTRYGAASVVALAVDAATYLGMIRLAGVHYMIAAPVGYALGMLVIYFLCTEWVFSNRRLTNVNYEFAIFTLIGVLGLLVNQAVIYMCVDRFSTSYELAKVVSAVVGFGVNFGSRKLVLFTRF